MTINHALLRNHTYLGADPHTRDFTERRPKEGKVAYRTLVILFYHIQV